jgi:hypothetical protein
MVDIFTVKNMHGMSDIKFTMGSFEGFGLLGYYVA